MNSRKGTVAESGRKIARKMSRKPQLPEELSRVNLNTAGILDTLTAKIPLCRLGVQAWTVQLEFPNQYADYNAAERYSIILRHIIL